MSVASLAAMFFLSLLCLAIASQIAITYLRRAATWLRVSNFIIGSVLLAFATTLPEFSSTVISQIKGYGDVALGIVVGTVLANICLILGISIYLSRKYKMTKFELDGLNVLLLSAVLLIVFSLDGIIGRLESIVFIAFFFAHQARLAFKMKEKSRLKKMTPKFTIHMIFVCVAVVALIASASYVVKFGEALALAAAIPPAIIGLILIGIGTSLPELASAISSAIKDHEGIAIGNLLGASTLDILLIVGIAAMFRPLVFDPFYFVFPMFLMVTSISIISLRLSKKRVLDRKSAYILVSTYIIFLIYLLFFGL